MWDQYIRDLAIFGTNTIELLPHAPMISPTARIFHYHRLI